MDWHRCFDPTDYRAITSPTEVAGAWQPNIPWAGLFHSFQKPVTYSFISISQRGPMLSFGCRTVSLWGFDLQRHPLVFAFETLASLPWGKNVWFCACARLSAMAVSSNLIFYWPFLFRLCLCRNCPQTKRDFARREQEGRRQHLSSYHPRCLLSCSPFHHVPW